MAVGVVVPIVLAAATVASTAYSIYSNVQAGHEARSQRHDYERQLALEKEQLEAQKWADVKAERDRRQRTLARQEAVYSASGLKMEGSPLLVQADTIAKSEENLARILSGSNLAIGATDTQASISRSRGNQEEQATRYRTVQSGVGGAYSLYNVGKGYNWWS